MSRLVQSVGHNDTKVLVRILNHDDTIVNSISEVKQRRLNLDRI